MNNELNRLDFPEKEERLAALDNLYRETAKQGNLPEKTEEVNNHVHTCYSFSPYTPVQAAYMAWKSGLQAVGIMDHDSFAGASEMEEACRILGIGSTCGMELRVNCFNSPLSDRKLNNPDSKGIFYMAIHGIPSNRMEEAQAFLKPIHEARNVRNRKQTEKLNELITPFGLKALDFDKDIRAYSQADEGGSITERHILAALSRSIINQFGKGKDTLDFLESKIGLSLSVKVKEFLSDKNNPHYLYDLLGVLKSSFLPRFFIQPDKSECIPVEKAVAFGDSVGGISAYAYLGDVGESPTGDKKAEQFEDSFLDELFLNLKEWGFRAVTFMPPRNTLEQLRRLMTLCTEYGFMQISGVDINSSRQSFHCSEVLLDDFAHLNESTWALIAHEKTERNRPGSGLFGTESLTNTDEAIEKRIEYYSSLGKELDLRSLTTEDWIRRG